MPQQVRGLWTNLLMVIGNILLSLVLVSAYHAPNLVDRVWSLAISPDASFLARASDSGITVFDVRAHSLVAQFPRAKFARFSPDGMALAIVGSKEIITWDTGRHSSERMLRPAMEKVTAISFSPNGQLLAAGGENGSVEIFSLGAAKLLRVLNVHGNDLDELCFAPDGKTLAVGGVIRQSGPPDNPPRVKDEGKESKEWGHLIQLWDVESGTLLKTIHGPEYTFVRGLSFSPDGRRLVTTGPNRVWDVSTGKVFCNFSNASGLVYHSPIFFSPDGTAVVGNDHDGWAGHSIKLFDAQTGKERLVLPACPGLAWSATFMEGGKILVTADETGSLNYWDASSGQLLQSVTGLVPNWIPAYWGWLFVGGLVWAGLWLGAFPRHTERVHEACFMRQRASWWLTTFVFLLVAGIGVMLHWVVLGNYSVRMFDPIAVLTLLVPSELIALIIVLILGGNRRFTVFATLVNTCLLIALIYLTGHFWAAIVAAV